MNRYAPWVSILLAGLLLGGCIAPQISFFSDASDPLNEYRLSGSRAGKVVVIPVQGTISDEVDDRMLRSKLK